GALTHGEPDSAGVPASFAEKTIVLPYNQPEALEKVFAEKGEEIAAIIVESYPANAGFVMPQPGYLDLLSSITSKHGALLIFDEVMTGFRLGKAGVQGIEKLSPDLSCFGKVIGGGLPVGAFGGRAEIMDHLAPDGPVYQAGTLSGNPLAMAAGLAQLRELDKPSGYPRLEELGAHFEKGLRQIMDAKGMPYRLNRVGSMFCLFFTDREILNVEDVMKQDMEVFKKLFWGCLDKGIYLAPSPYETGFLSLAHTEADLDDTLSVMEDVLKTI
ncbi:MAG: aminotransferase class III-fold pyridoxal phosphate-dependent enzyme, partial [Akkermansiaceae bacterium]|nr:aminotransferase class III-fold pyridoxal phosphate-dependent enzyme [Akkermansiaceae bacterium]